MAFDDSTVSDVRAASRNGELLVSWSSTAPDGARFQVYVDRVLAWSGRSRRAVIPAGPRATGTLHVGIVGPGEAVKDFSAGLTSVASTRPRLRWQGGTYLGVDVRGFRVYASSVPGGLVDYAAGPVAEVSAYPAAAYMDGFGLGGFGEGGFGFAASDYEWTGPALPSGVWSFAVKAFDVAGNESSSWSFALTVSGPPSPPPLRPGVGRLAMDGPGTGIAWDAPTTSLVDFWSRP